MSTSYEVPANIAATITAANGGKEAVTQQHQMPAPRIVERIHDLPVWLGDNDIQVPEDAPKRSREGRIEWTYAPMESDVCKVRLPEVVEIVVPAECGLLGDEITVQLPYGVLRSLITKAEQARRDWETKMNPFGFIVQCSICPQQAIVATQPVDGWVCPRCAEVAELCGEHTGRASNRCLLPAGHEGRHDDDPFDEMES